MLYEPWILVVRRNSIVNFLYVTASRKINNYIHLFLRWKLDQVLKLTTEFKRNIQANLDSSRG